MIIYTGPGVYKITNTVNGRSYVGSSHCAIARLSDHVRLFTKLSSRSHLKDNKELVEDIKKYGAHVFVFEIIEETSDYLPREQYYLDNTPNLYNRAPNAGTNSGVVWTEAMRAARRGSKNPIHTSGANMPAGHDHRGYGREVSKETREKTTNTLIKQGRTRAGSILTEYTALEVISLIHNNPDMLTKDIAQIYGVKGSAISNIKAGVSWPKLPRPWPEGRYKRAPQPAIKRKLDYRTAELIRYLHSTHGQFPADLVMWFGTSVSNIRLILRNKIWTTLYE